MLMHRLAALGYTICRKTMAHLQTGHPWLCAMTWNGKLMLTPAPTAWTMGAQ